MPNMFESDFDPLSRLEENERVIEELIQAVNNQAKFMEELASQHEKLTKQNYQMSVHLKQVTDELRHIKGLSN